ncbi:MAG: hypothetical protein ACMXYD_01375 [Candidatus Woesearchaeota archaeon]
MKGFIPNPFDSSSTLTTLKQQATVIQGSLRLYAALKNALGILLFGALLVYIGLPIGITLLIVSGGLVSTAIISVFTIKELKKLTSQNTQEEEAYRRIIQTSEYYDFIRSVTSFFFSALTVSTAFILFFEEITRLSIQNLPIDSTYLPYLLWTMVFFHCIQIVFSYLRYSWVKKLPYGEVAEVQQAFTVVQKKISLIKNLPPAITITTFFGLVGIPWFLLVSIIVVFSVMGLLSWVELVRVQQASVSSEIDKSVVEREMKPREGEQVAGAVFGVMKVAASFLGVFEVVGKETLGSGKSRIPENSMIITNCRILLVQIPLSGGNTIVSGVDYASTNFFYNRGELIEKGERFLKQATISELFAIGIRDVLFSEIQTVIIKKNKVVITKKNRKKIAYAWLDKEIYESIRRILPYYLADKVTIH